MNSNKTRERLLASSMICGVALAGLAATPAAAQAGAQSAATDVSEIVVTGSRIPQPNLTSTSPITVVGSADVKLQGVTRTEDLLNSLPQVFAGQGSAISNGSSGTATVNLRGLGASRTLVLVDGRRLVPGDPQVPVADLNFIPSPLVERVEVLTGGASAAYGSDAIAGVVNFIMLKNFEGVRLEAQVSEYQHDNNNSFLRGLNTARGFNAPSGSIWDGRQTEISAVLGVNTADGKGNATVYATYRNAKPILQAARDYSFCSLNETSTSFACGGSGTTAPSHIISNDLGALKLPNSFILDAAGPGNTVRTFLSSDQFNFAPFNYYQRPDDSYAAGAFAHYEVNPHLDAYAQFMFMDDHTLAQLAPSGLFGQPVNIACNNPILSAQEVQTFCTNAGLGPTDTASLSILRRNVEGGGRVDNLRHTDYRVVIGAKGPINDDWSYDAYAQIGRSVYQEEFLNDFSLRRINNALDVTTDASGNLVCASQAARDEHCVPYNPFSLTGITPAALAYVSAPGFKEGATTEAVVDASVTGKLNFLKSPLASDPVGVALGTEYRRESLDLRTDAEIDTGDLTTAAQVHPVSGSFDVYELFGEARIPLAQDLPYAKDLTLELGYRYSDYSSIGTTDTYKVAGDWQPVDDLRVRASYQRAVRAPNIVELFTPQAVGLALSSDPCAGPTPEATAEQCARTGVSASQYGAIAANSSSQYNALLGGNPNLRPETSDSYSVGFVLTPRFAPGFSLSVDYYDIKVQDFIQPLTPDLTLASCLQTGAPALCGLVHRAPVTGSLWLGNDGFVTATNVNVGSLQTKGVDVEATYRTDFDRFGLNNWGGISLNLTGTYLDQLITDPGIPTTDPAGHAVTTYDCAGLYGGTICGTPNPKWRHRLRATWSTPWSGVQVSGAWRYFSSVKFQGTSSNPFLAGGVSVADQKLAAQSYFDLTAQFHLRDRYTFRIGVNNIFDKEPPIGGSASGGANPSFNGNTYPQVYDALGRFGFLSVTADF